MKRLISILALSLALLPSFSQQLPEGFKVQPVPSQLNLDKFWQKYVDCNGIAIVSSWRVPDSCLVQAYKTIDAMTRMLPKKVLKSMVDYGTKVGVMARYEGTTDVPEHHHLINDTTLNWDLRARGLEGTLEIPMTTCAEENILAYQIDPYHAEDILIHEFAHSIHLIGLKRIDPSIDDKIQKLMDQAIAEGKYKNTYALENFIEYWAEGVQDWFNVNAEAPLPNGKHNWVNTREDLKKYDPRLYKFISKYLPETDEQISKHPKVNLYTDDDPEAFRKLNYEEPLNISIPKCEITGIPEPLKVKLRLSSEAGKQIVTVRQQRITCRLSLLNSPEEFTNFSSGGDSISLKIKSNTDWTLSLAPDSELSATFSKDSGKYNGEVTMYVAENYDLNSKTGTLVLSSPDCDTVKVALLQESGKPYVKFPKGKVMAANDGLDNFAIPIKANVSWTASVLSVSGYDKTQVSVVASGTRSDTTALLTFPASLDFSKAKATIKVKFQAEGAEESAVATIEQAPAIRYIFGDPYSPTFHSNYKSTLYTPADTAMIHSLYWPFATYKTINADKSVTGHDDGFTWTVTKARDQNLTVECTTSNCNKHTKEYCKSWSHCISIIA